MIVYKYVVPERVDVLENGLIRFSQPEDFNDPFESMPNWSDYVDSVIATLIGSVEVPQAVLDSGIEDAAARIKRTVTARIQAFYGNDFALLSLTKQCNNLLMWAHYSSAHTGFVIGFDSLSPFFAAGSKSINGLKEVRYSADRWTVPPGGLEGLKDEDMLVANDQLFWTKSNEWAYEEELRIMAHPNAADKRIPVPGRCDICLFKFPPECLKVIILGYRMSKENARTVSGLISKLYPHARLFTAQIDDRRFALRIHPLIDS